MPLSRSSQGLAPKKPIKIKGIEVHLTRALTGYHVGLLHTENSVMDVWFTSSLWDSLTKILSAFILRKRGHSVTYVLNLYLVSR